MVADPGDKGLGHVETCEYRGTGAGGVRGELQVREAGLLCGIRGFEVWFRCQQGGFGSLPSERGDPKGCFGFGVESVGAAGFLFYVLRVLGYWGAPGCGVCGGIWSRRFNGGRGCDSCVGIQDVLDGF